MDRQQKIVSMFDAIAPTYDLANRVLSFGVDKGWRKKACDMAYRLYGKKELDLIVDVACGTGDMIDYWRKRAVKKGISLKKLIGVDPSKKMLEVARKKLEGALFVQGEAKHLPLGQNVADLVSISYGIRNVVDRREALGEFCRVLKPGGLVVILEFTKNTDTGVQSKLVDFYMKRVLPLVGGVVSKNYEAYRYLPDSIEGFLTSGMLTQELVDAGFEVLVDKSFSMNISTLLIARKR